MDFDLITKHTDLKNNFEKTLQVDTATSGVPRDFQWEGIKVGVVHRDIGKFPFRSHLNRAINKNGGYLWIN